MPRIDPDEHLVVLFRHHAVRNEAKTLAAGRLIYDDVELCEIRAPGSKDTGAFPALSFSHWGRNPHTGEQVIITYAERFPRQYRQFKEQQTQTKSGTPLEYVPFLTAARQAELRALNVYTVEQLAGMDGQELKNLGPGGRDLKNKAEEFIAESLVAAPNKALAVELEKLKARNQVLEEDNELLKTKLTSGEGEFEDMSNDALREYIRVNTGAGPVGQPSRRTLIRMAMDCRPAEKAA
jgi:hypothetical protein